MERNKYPQYENILKLVKDLPNEKALKDYLAYMRWGGNPHCIHCQKPDFVRVYSKPGFYECSSCKIQFSVQQGTIFERSPIPLDIWFWALFEFCSDLNSSPVSAARHTIQQKTAWKMNMRIRETLWEELKTTLSGTIYCDETELGADPQRDLRVYHDKKSREKRKLPPNHYMEVFGMLEAGKGQKAIQQSQATQGGKLLLFAIDNKSAETLQDLMYKNTDTFNSEFVTDGWIGYRNYGYSCERHYVLNKSKFGKYDFKKHVRKVHEYTLELATDEEIAAGKFMTLTNNPIENVWSKLEPFYKRYYGFSREYAQMYLNEFMFRWNHNHLSNGDRFQILLERCLNTPLYKGFGIYRKKITLESKFTRRPKRKGFEGSKWKPLP